MPPLPFSPMLWTLSWNQVCSAGRELKVTGTPRELSSTVGRSYRLWSRGAVKRATEERDAAGETETAETEDNGERGTAESDWVEVGDCGSAEGFPRDEDAGVGGM